MPTTTKNAQTGISTGSGVAWTNPAGAELVDGALAVSGPAAPANTQELRLTNLGLSLAATDLLVGLEVRITRKYGGIGDTLHVSDYRIQLTVNGAVIGDNKASAVYWSPNLLRVDVFGSSSDLWNCLTEAIAQNSTFGLSLIATIGDMGAAASVDGVDFVFTYLAAETLIVPVLSGSESVVGIVKESSYGVTPASGADPNKTITSPIFFPCKQESIQANEMLDVCTDGMNSKRRITRITANGARIRGPLRFTGGPESLGYFLTMLMGSPVTTTLAASSGTSEGAYQHVWYPGQRANNECPVPYSIESQYAQTRSKLIQGAVCVNLGIQLANNGAMVCIPEFIGKSIRWLYPDSDDANGSGTTDLKCKLRPAVMTASPVLIDEQYFHFSQIAGYPQISDQNFPTILNVFLTPGYETIEGQFTAGSGNEIGTYRVDNFHMQGRMQVLFSDEGLYDQFIHGDPFKLEISLIGDTIQGAYANRLNFSAAIRYGEPDLVNQVGSLAYDIPWHAAVDPATNKACEFTLINTVSAY